MRLRAVLVGLIVAVASLAGCLPADPGPTGLYLGKQPDITPVVTPKAQPVTWGSAPPIDASYGGTIYAGYPTEQQDPRPPLTADGKQPLRLWIADPADRRVNRPAILWVHGGGFAVGIDSMHGLASGTGREYAQRGYVGISVEYRIDTTLLGPATRPKSLCQWVQDNRDPNDPVWVERRARCTRNIIAAQRDVQAAVRWVRAHATELGVDPNRIAVGGFSAGAVTAANLAYRNEDVGSHAYFPGDDLSPARSRVQAAIGASGCAYPEVDGGIPTYIDRFDTSVSLIHAEIDGAVPYECAATTVTVARAAGITAELLSFCDEVGHAAELYQRHKAETDVRWTTFLARTLLIYKGMPPPVHEPTCDRS